MLMHTRSLLLGLTAVLLTGACVDPPFKPIENEYPPKGVMRGTVTYSGPMPCSEQGHIVGNVQILVFNVNLLPPPDGLGLSAHRITAVPGDVLFADAAPSIPVNPDGSRACPPAGTTVTATATFEVGPIDPGVYQVRAFFDYDGDFSPAFKMRNMVTRGDVGGGAIANITQVLQGKESVRYQEIPIGVLRDGVWTIPDEGFVASNVGVTISGAAVIPTQRPYFHVSAMQYPKTSPEDTLPAPIANPLVPEDPSQPDPILIPADYHIADANKATIHEYLFKMSVQGGMPGIENDAAVKEPFLFHTATPGELFLSSYDADHNGVINGNDHITGSTVRSIGPIVSFTKLDRARDPDNLWRISQATPRVLSSGITVESGDTLLVALGKSFCETPDPNEKNKTCTSNADCTLATCDPQTHLCSGCKPKDKLVDAFDVYIRPSAVCLADASNPSSATVIVTPFLKDMTSAQKDIIDQEATINDIAVQLRRDAAQTTIAEHCLPPGYYAINVIYPSTGQAWTLPNESGVCMPGEQYSLVNGLPVCGVRAKLSSQFLYVRFGDAKDPAYCNAKRKGRNEPDPYRDTCLTPEEREKYLEGTLWGGPPNPLP